MIFEKGSLERFSTVIIFVISLALSLLSFVYITTDLSVISYKGQINWIPLLILTVITYPSAFAS